MQLRILMPFDRKATYQSGSHYKIAFSQINWLRLQVIKLTYFSKEKIWKGYGLPNHPPNLIVTVLTLKKEIRFLFRTTEKLTIYGFALHLHEFFKVNLSSCKSLKFRYFFTFLLNFSIKWDVSPSTHLEDGRLKKDLNRTLSLTIKTVPTFNDFTKM